MGIKIEGQTLTQKSGGGCATLFGLPFFLAGLGVMACVFIPADVRGGDDFPWYVGIPFGGIFAAVGGGIMFFRSGMVLDKQHGTIIDWWGFLIPFKKKTYQLSDYDHVLITKEVRRSDKSSYTVYPVYLQNSDGGAEKLDFDEDRDVQTSRKLGEDIARFLEMPLSDRSSGEAVVRNHDELDDSLRDQAIKAGEGIDIPDAPANMKSQIEMLPGELHITIPGLGFHWAMLVPVIFVLGFICIPIFQFIIPILEDFGDSGESQIFKWVFVSFIGLFFVLLPLLTIVPKIILPIFTKQYIYVTPDFIEIKNPRKTKKSFKRTVRMDASEVEEITSTSNGGGDMPKQLSFLKYNSITLKSDEHTIHIGGSLDSEEIDYIKALIHSVLIA